MTTTESSFVRLSKINVNDKIEKKNGLSYLSWAWAVDQLMRADPDASWEYEASSMHGSDTVMVYCAVTAFGKKRTAHLPVMNHMNKAISQPDAFQVNTAMQRCLVKAIALHGLGLYIYAGEDLPNGEHAEPAHQQERGSARPGTPEEMKRNAFNDMDPDEQEFLRKVAADVTALLTEEREDDAHGFLEAKRLDDEEKLAIWFLFDSKQRAALKRAGARAEQMRHATDRANKAGAPARTPQ